MRKIIWTMLILSAGLFARPAAAQDEDFNISADEAAVLNALDREPCDKQFFRSSCAPSCDPWLHAEANALYWTRGIPKSAAIARNQGSGDTIFNADEFDFNWRLGVEGDFAIRLEGPLSVNCRYFWLDDLRATALTPDPGADYFYGNSPVSSTLQLDQRYLSGLQGAEANFIYEFKPWLSWIAGFRWNQIHERLTNVVSRSAPAFEATFNFDTNNDLYGGQLGADVRVINGKRLNINVLGKIGVLGNFAVADSDLTIPSQTYYSFARDTHSKTAMVWELRCEARWRFNDHWAATAGYSLMWFDGVALASNQPNATDNMYFGGGGIVPMTIDIRDTVFYHGGLAGLECRF